MGTWNFTFWKKSLWKHIENENGSLEEICIADKIDISLYDNTNQNEKNNPETLTEEKEVNKKVTDLQKKILLNFEKELTNNKEKLIFNKRIFNSEYKISKLKDLSSLLNISVQRINKIEKKLKSKVKDIFDIEKKISGHRINMNFNFNKTKQGGYLHNFSSLVRGCRVAVAPDHWFFFHSFL